MRCDVSGIVELCRLGDKSSVMLLEQKSKTFRPGHFIAVDHGRKKVVVSIRGTMRLQDILTDLICHSIPFKVPVIEDGAGDDLPNTPSDSSSVSGMVHEGFLRAAQTLALELHEPVDEALLINPGYSLVCTGHSAGGAVASLLALIWAQLPGFMERSVKGYSFAAPCVVSHSLSRSAFARKHVTSVALGDDLVCRLSQVSTAMLLETCDRLACPGLSAEDKMAVLERARKNRNMRAMREAQHYPAGLAYHLPLRRRYGEKSLDVGLAEEVDPTQSMDEIILSPKIFSVHLPSVYLNAIRKQLILQQQQQPQQAAKYNQTQDNNIINNNPDKPVRRLDTNKERNDQDKLRAAL